MKLSFKFKIALISLAVTGTLLSGFGVALFAFVYSVAAERLDEEVLALVEAPFRGPPDQVLDERFGRTLQAIFGEKRAGQTALMVLGDCEGGWVSFVFFLPVGSRDQPVFAV